MAMSSLRQFIVAGILIAALLFSAGCTQQPGETVKLESNTGTHTLTPAGTPAGQVPVTTAVPVSSESWKKVRLETNRGNITVALDPAMPVTTGNFESLVQ